MARSTYVYVVVRGDLFGFGRLPVAAFTVKHELKKWLKGQASPELLRFFRLQDGSTTRPVKEMTRDEVENG